jgi:hypothetical protein
MEPIPQVPKNYKLSSYELQTGDVFVDINKVRRDNGRTGNGWPTFAISYLDINGDGNDDIYLHPVTGENKRTDGELYLYKNGNYVLDNSYFNEVPSVIHARKSIVGDFNNDKRPDIFISAHGYDQDPWPGEYTQMLLSNPNGKYTLKSFSDKIGFYHSASSADIDNDGDLDIFVLNKMFSYFLINDGVGNFTYSTTQIDVFDIHEEYTCELIDINKDGYVDLIMGGHEFDAKNTTRIYWGNSSFKYTERSDIPKVNEYGVITDIDVYDLDGDGINELTINRAGGNGYNQYFYDGWYIQILKMNGKQFTDVTSQFIENNSIGHIGRYNWLIWVRFQDYDKNGKMDLFSTICGEYGFVRWELRDKKLVRVI